MRYGIYGIYHIHGIYTISVKINAFVGMPQAFLNLPDDIWGFTEVWGKATGTLSKPVFLYFLP